jgi:hypothetical protein
MADGVDQDYWPSKASSLAKWIVAGILGSHRPVVADEIAVPQPPEICSLSVGRDVSSGSVIVTWTGGTPPFTVIRADGPCFGQASELKYLSQDVGGHRYIDRGALRAKRRFWYQVYDVNSGPTIFSISSGEPKEPDPSTIHPNGSGECGDDESCKGKQRSPTTWK